MEFSGPFRPVPALKEHLLGRFERMDWFLLGCALILTGIGLLFIAGAGKGAAEGAAGPSFLFKQILYLVLGLACFAFVQRLDYLAFLKAAPLLYLLGLGLLIAVLFTRPINGARSWFNLYVFNLQPSEIMKPILILALAYYLMYEDSYKRLGGLVLPLLLCLVPMALILKQPDLGTTLVLIPVAFAILLAAGARLWHLALVGLGGSGGLVLMWFTVMKDYQKARILAWLDPEAYRLREAYQLLLSRVAIGSGGFLGTWGDSKQSGLDLLPEKHTDFIFAVVAEQGGFLAAGTLLTVLFLMTLSGFGIALRTREPAGRLIAVGIATLLGGQALVNASVALGLLPTTGLTFPFVSYGGSSLISSFLCLGLLINIGSLRPPSFGRKN